MNTLWNAKNYLIPLPYIVATNIYEYDIRKANINVLRALNYISSEYYNKLNNMSRMERQIEIGYMIRNDSNVYSILDTGIKHYKKLLFETNNIDDANIVSIKNDAVFVMGNKLAQTVFPNQYNTVEFILKNQYTSYYKLLNLEIYFKSDMVTGNLTIDIKGLGEKINLHQRFIGWIAEILYLIETGDIEIALNEVKEFYNLYINRQLDIEYYRQLNSESMYILTAGVYAYGIMDLPHNTDISVLDIGYNIQIIRTIYGYVSQLFFMKRT